MNPSLIQTIVVYALPVIFAITLHEAVRPLLPVGAVAELGIDGACPHQRAARSLPPSRDVSRPRAMSPALARSRASRMTHDTRRALALAACPAQSCTT